MRPAILNPLFTPVTDLPGIGPKSAALIERIAGPHLWDVLRAQPHRVQQRTRIDAPSDLYEDQLVTLPLLILQPYARNLTWVFLWGKKQVVLSKEIQATEN